MAAIPIAGIRGPVRRGEPVQLDDLGVGDLVVVISEFWGCVSCGGVRRVRKGRFGLYVKCTEGQHYLDGQVSADEGAPLEGLERVAKGKAAHHG